MKKMPIVVEVDDEVNMDELKKILEKVNVHLVSNNDLPPSNDGKKIAELFEEIRKAGGLTSFGDDPSAWQREQREDRKLPFRED